VCYPGGYWTLEKRHGDLPKLRTQWSRWLQAMQPCYRQHLVGVHIPLALHLQNEEALSSVFVHTLESVLGSRTCQKEWHGSSASWCRLWCRLWWLIRQWLQVALVQAVVSDSAVAAGGVKDGSVLQLEQAALATLGAKMEIHAHALDSWLRRLQQEYGSTIIHGDFKTANLFFRQAPGQSLANEASSEDVDAKPRPSESHIGTRALDECQSGQVHEGDGSERIQGMRLLERESKLPFDAAAQINASGLQVCACDFQWAGRGLGVQDVMYLLWTSVEPSVVRAHEAQLLEFYAIELCARLEKQHPAYGSSRTAQWSSCHSMEPVVEQYEVRLLSPRKNTDGLTI
jgi:hypothetical protein